MASPHAAWSRSAARALGVVILLRSGTAVAAPSACEAAHLAAQKHRAAGELAAAKESLLACARAACPGLVQSDCTRWLDEVEAEQPTLVLSAKADGGAELTTVVVSVDDAVLPDALDGRPIPMDPGSHRVRFEADGYRPATLDVVVRAGAKLQPLSVTLVPVLAPEARDDAGPTIAVATLSAVAGASLLAFGGLAIAGQVEFSDLEDTCAPTCSQADADAVQTKFVAADVLLGVGIAAAVGAVAVGIVTLELADASPAGTAPATARLGVVPTDRGAAVVVHGSF